MSASPAAPLITTVVPTYRRPKLLRRAIRSVLDQSFGDFQVCVYDDASGDETEQVVRELASADWRVKYFRHAQNIGGMANYIFGMSRVQTPFFSLLPDDDVILPGFFEKALEGFTKYPEAMASVLATLHADDEARITAVPLLAWKEGLYRPPSGLLTMLQNDCPMMMGILFRQETLKHVGTFSAEAGTFADLDYELRIAAKWPVVVSREPGAIFVSHRTNLSKTETLTSHWKFWQRMNAVIQQDKTIPDDARTLAHKQLLRRFYQGNLAFCGLRHVAERQWDTADVAAKILREGYQRPFRAFVLRFLSRIGRKWPAVSAPFRAVRRMRPFVTRPAAKVPAQYSRYAELLKS
jgi:glycosyltransferase involved in cell wall biosynthesis